MMRRLIPLVGMVMMLGSSDAQLQSGGTFQIDNNYIVGLSSPVAMTMAPDGRMFIAEQAGNIRVWLTVARHGFVSFA